jgi:rhomboid protease GluP
MDELVDYGGYTEADLLDIARRIDPRRAGANFQGLKVALEAKGYAIAVNEFGQVAVSWSSSSPSRFLDVPTRFGQSRGPLSWMEPSRNDFRLVGAGKVRVDNATVEVSGKALNFFLGFAFPSRVTLDRERIVNVETTGGAVRFEYTKGGSRPKALTLHLADSATAEEVVSLLPHTRTSGFQPKLPRELEFDQRVLSQHPHVPATITLVIANLVVFLAMLANGASLFRPSPSIDLAWGANFGPYTTDGDWWRLLTCDFLHLSVLHVLLNMWALSAVGPLVERLYGSLTFLFIYLCAGIISSLASIVWAPVSISVGASGPIFGVYGALLAALASSGESIPRSLVAPLRNSTAVFVISTVVAGFLWNGIDNAAHLGGLAAGFGVGSILARNLAFDNTQRHAWVFGTAALVIVVTVAAGGILAWYRTPNSGPDGLFWQTQHWLVRGELVAQGKWVNISRLVKENKLDDAGFADAIDSTVLPFWREADERLTSLAPPTGDAALTALSNLRALAASRKAAFEVCVIAGRTRDEGKARQCHDDLERGDRLIEGFSKGRGAHGVKAQ